MNVDLWPDDDDAVLEHDRISVKIEKMSRLNRPLVGQTPVLDPDMNYGILPHPRWVASKI